MAAPALKQAVVKSTYSGTSKFLDFTGACTPGSSLIAFASTEDGTQTISIADPTNGTWTNRVQANRGNGGNAGDGRSCIADFLTNTANSALRVTLTPSGSANGIFAIYEIDAAAFDASQTGNNAATDNAITLTTVAANCFSVSGGNFYPNNSSGADTGWTGDQGPSGVSNSYHFCQHHTDTGAAGGKAITFTDTGSENIWCTVGASYSAAGGGGGGTTRGMPFGHRGTAFNGGRTFNGILQRSGLWLPQTNSLLLEMMQTFGNELGRSFYSKLVLSMQSRAQHRIMQPARSLLAS